MARAALACLLLLTACAPKQQHFEGQTMATTWRVTVANAPQEVTAQMIQSRLDELEQIFSNWRADSAVSKWNASTSTAFQPVPREVAEVINEALKISAASDGALDVTVAPLVDLWGFGPRGKIATLPDEAAIAEARAHGGWENLEVQLDPPMLRKADPKVAINVSTFVEGYAADEIARLLRAHACEVCLVDVGGAIVARGKEWSVGLQTPGAPQGEAMTMLPLRDQAVTTSGTYRKRVEAGGQSFSHIIDPHTGYPIDNSLASVSVIHESALKADGWDTTLMVLGPERGRLLAKQLGLRAIFVEERK